MLWVLFTWLLYGCIVYSVVISKATSWIGMSSCIVLPSASMVIRLVERHLLEIRFTPHSSADAAGAAVIIGRKNSCVVIEGSRKDVAHMTEFGLQTKAGPMASTLEMLVRICALLLLLFIFVTTLNGSTWDQVAFICVNLLGQLNNIIGRWLNSHRCIAKFHKEGQDSPATRTHMYAFLLRRYGSGDWVDKVNLLPGTDLWRRWQQKIVVNRTVDAKELYEDCHKELAIETSPGARPTTTLSSSDV